MSGEGALFEGRVRSGKYYWAVTPTVYRVVPGSADVEVPGSPHVWEPSSLQGEDVTYRSLRERAAEVGDGPVQELAVQHEFAHIDGDPSRATRFASKFGLLGIGESRHREPLDHWFYESAAMAMALRALASLARDPLPSRPPFDGPVGEHEVDVWECEDLYRELDPLGVPTGRPPFPAADERHAAWQDERWGVLHALVRPRVEQHCGLTLITRGSWDWPVDPADGDGSSPLRLRLSARNLLGVMWFELARAVESGEWAVCDLCGEWWLKEDSRSNRRWCKRHEEAVGNLRKKARALQRKGFSGERIAVEMSLPLRGIVSLLEPKNPGRRNLPS